MLADCQVREVDGSRCLFTMGMAGRQFIATFFIKLNAILLAVGGIAGWVWIPPGWSPAGKGWMLAVIVLCLATPVGLCSLVYANARACAEIGPRWRLVNAVSVVSWLAAAGLLPQQMATVQRMLNDFSSHEGETAAGLGLAGLIVLLVAGFVVNLGVVGCCGVIGFLQRRGIGPHHLEP